MRTTRLMAACLAGALVATGVGLPATALSTATTVADGTWPFVAKIDVDGRQACTGALIDSQWVITASSCLTLAGQPPATGEPPAPTTVTVGRAGLTTTAGRVLPVVRVVPHPSRDVALLKLSVRILDVAPIAVATRAPATGDPVHMAGYGRTASEWVPDRLRGADVSVDGVAGTTFGWSGGNVSACRGDAGGPVFRDGGAGPELAGITVASWQGGCLGESSTRYGATAARLDDIRDWITSNTPGLTAAFGASYSSQNGIGSYDVASTADQVVPFDFDHSGKLDHLVAYRPGTGIVYILKHNADNSFSPVFTSRTGIGGYDLKVDRDRIVPFDYNHSGKLDHLLIYRPGWKTAFILKHNADNSFAPVFATTTAGIGGYDLADPLDQIVAFDYDHSGKMDHLVAYRPGSKIAYILKHNADNSFGAVFTGRNGIGGYDLAVDRDRVVAFDYDHSGKMDHLVAYRPGSKIAYILKHNADNSFAPVYSNATTGIGGYDLADARDQVIAFDYQHTGRLDHLVLYRPGAKTVFIVEHRANNTFAPVYSTGTAGIGGYDLAVDRDRIVAFDYEHAGAPDYLLLYRPGNGAVWIAGRRLTTG